MANQIITNSPQVEIYILEQFDNPGQLCETCDYFKVNSDIEEPTKFTNDGICMWPEWAGEKMNRFNGCPKWIERKA